MRHVDQRQNLVEFLLGVDAAGILVGLDGQPEDGGGETCIDEIEDVADDVDLLDSSLARSSVAVRLEELRGGACEEGGDFSLPFRGMKTFGKTCAQDLARLCRWGFENDCVGEGLLGYGVGSNGDRWRGADGFLPSVLVCITEVFQDEEVLGGHDEGVVCVDGVAFEVVGECAQDELVEDTAVVYITVKEDFVVSENTSARPV